MLTGQCKSDFFSWLENNYELIIKDCGGLDYFWASLPHICEYALITEWFDSVGIYVSVNHSVRHEWFSFKVCADYTDGFETRQEATKAAIEKANELYNDKFK